MVKLKKLNAAIALWGLISLSFAAVIYAVSDAFLLETMVARAEARELDRHFRNLGAILAEDPDRMLALDHEQGTGRETRLAATGSAEEGRAVRARPGLVPAAYSPPFRSADRTGSNLPGMARTAVLNGDAWNMVSGLHPAAGNPAPSGNRPVLDDFKQTSGVDVALFVVRDGKVTPLATTLAGAAWLTDDELHRVTGGETILRERRVGELEAAILAGPVHDPSGRPVGVAAIAHDQAGFTAIIGTLRTAGIGIGLLLLFVGACIACALSAKPARV
jgi:hypothetical protein